MEYIYIYKIPFYEQYTVKPQMSNVICSKSGRHLICWESETIYPMKNSRLIRSDECLLTVNAVVYNMKTRCIYETY